MKVKLLVSLNHLPYCEEIYKKRISDISQKDINKFLIIKGTVIRTTIRKNLEKMKIIQCDQCQNQTIVGAQIEDFN